MADQGYSVLVDVLEGPGFGALCAAQRVLLRRRIHSTVGRARKLLGFTNPRAHRRRGNEYWVATDDAPRSRDLERRVHDVWPVAWRATLAAAKTRTRLRRAMPFSVYLTINDANEHFVRRVDL